jgi:hypothetical protein
VFKQRDSDCPDQVLEDEHDDKQPRGLYGYITKR